MSDDQDQNETSSQTSSHTPGHCHCHCHCEDDTSSESSSVPSPLLSRPTSPEHDEPMTVDKILQQIRQLEAEEHAKKDGEQTLPEPLRVQLHMVLLDVEFFGPLMCRTLKPLLVLSLVRLLRALKEHVRNHPSFHTHRVPRPDKDLLEYWANLAKYTRACVIWFLVCVRACLGFKKYRFLQQRLCLIEQYILWNSERLGISLNEAMSCSLAMPREGTGSPSGHPLFGVRSKLGNVSADFRLLSTIGYLSRIHQKAFAFIYGVTVDEAATAVLVPGMAHVLNLRGTAHFNPVVAGIQAFTLMVLDNVIPAISAFRDMVADGSISELTAGTLKKPGKPKEYTVLEIYISRLSRFKFWRPVDQKGFVLSYQARFHPERRRCFLLYCPGNSNDHPQGPQIVDDDHPQEPELRALASDKLAAETEWPPLYDEQQLALDDHPQEPEIVDDYPQEPELVDDYPQVPELVGS